MRSLATSCLPLPRDLLRLSAVATKLAMRAHRNSFANSPAEQLLLSGIELLESQGVLDLLPSAMKRLLEVAPRPWWAGAQGARAVQLGAASLAALTQNPRLGLSLGQKLPFGSRGVLDYLMRASATLRDVCLALERYQPTLMFDYLKWTLEETSARAQLSAKVSFALKMHPLVVDFRLSRELTFWRHLLGSFNWTPSEILLPYARPKSVRAYQETFGTAQLTFGAATFGFVFDNALLDRPLPGRDDQLRAILTQHADQLLAKLQPQTNSVADTLEDLLIAMLGTGKPTSPAVARRLGMSERTLRRRLEEEGLTYQAVLDRARNKLAQMYIEAGELGVEQLAQQLGFDSGSALRRAYERWTGASLRLRTSASTVNLTRH